jgi:hypothetical protein
MATAASKESIKKIMVAIKNFNDAHPDTPIAGYHNDQEPKDSARHGDLLDTLKIAQDWVDANEPELTISQSITPSWRSANVTWGGSTKTMNNHVIDLIGHAAYMAYSDSANTVLNTYAVPAVDRATAAGHKVAIGQETEDIAWHLDPSETWWDEIQAEPEATRFKVDAAAPVTFEDCMHGTAAGLIPKAGYDRMVIHQYSAYFTHWFGMRPRQYCLSRTGGAYDSAAESPEKVNLLDDQRPLTGLGPRHTNGPGDLNADGIVNIDDLTLVIGHFGQSSGDPGWDARADASGDGVVNIDDLGAVTGNYGRSY